jgi:hypothetical protein
MGPEPGLASVPATAVIITVLSVAVTCKGVPIAVFFASL